MDSNTNTLAPPTWQLKDKYTKFSGPSLLKNGSSFLDEFFFSVYNSLLKSSIFDNSFINKDKILMHGKQTRAVLGEKEPLQDSLLEKKLVHYRMQNNIILQLTDLLHDINEIKSDLQ